MFKFQNTYTYSYTYSLMCHIGKDNNVSTNLVLKDSSRPRHRHRNTPPRLLGKGNLELGSNLLTILAPLVHGPRSLNSSENRRIVLKHIVNRL